MTREAPTTSATSEADSAASAPRTAVTTARSVSALMPFGSVVPEVRSEPNIRSTSSCTTSPGASSSRER